MAREILEEMVMNGQPEAGGSGTGEPTPHNLGSPVGKKMTLYNASISHDVIESRPVNKQ